MIDSQFSENNSRARAIEAIQWFKTCNSNEYVSSIYLNRVFSVE